MTLSQSNASQILTLEWVDQLSSHSKISDLSQGVAIDGLGNIFISGWTSGRLGEEWFGSGDPFVSRYSQDGTLHWTRQFGTSRAEASWDVDADGFGNVFVAGYTQGSLGAPYAGGGDFFVSKFDRDGAMLWTQQQGGPIGETAYGLTADPFGNVYVTGYTTHGFDGLESRSHDIFVSKFDSKGAKLWTKLYGTESVDRAFDIATDALGNAYVTGYTLGEFPGNNRSGSKDAFVMKLDSAGVEQWTRQLGTPEEDFGNGLVVDGLGNAYVTGYTGGDLAGVSAGEDDVFLTKYDPTGELLWTRQFGAIGEDRGEALFADDLGHIYVTGRIESEVRERGSDQGDGFVSKYDRDGNLLWMDLFGTDEFDTSQGIAVDGSGKIYVSGFTGGNFDGTYESSINQSGDIFVAKFSQPVPEPSCWSISVMACLCAICFGNRVC